MLAEKNCSVYFVSTLLHLFVASSIAQAKPEERHILVFIDQPEGKEPFAYQLTKRWTQSPFVEHILFYGRFRGSLNKLRKRKVLFQQIKQLVEKEKPRNLFVGNDRRIEFQYAMHVAEKNLGGANGHYMDEGTFTYVGRQASSHFGDTVIDNLAKKLSYGFWWKNPPTVGASDWIKTIHVAFPELIDERLKNKIISKLSPDGFQCPALLELSAMMLEEAGISTAQINDYDALLTLPHESLFQADPGYSEKIRSIVDSLEGKTAVKYHPRNSAEDVLNLQENGLDLLPSKVSFEAILPHFKQGAMVIGDVSSTLLLTRWLRPDLAVKTYETTSKNSAFGGLFRNLDIRAFV